MFETSQDVLYVTLALCIAVFTVFLVWIMYYLAQISRQSNEMITDFRQKMAEFDATLTDIKEKVTNTVDTVAALGDQIGSVADMIGSFAGAVKKRRAKK